jgi:hypothetical protein
VTLETPLRLSVIIVVGENRKLAQQVIRAVTHQTRASALELVIVDLAEQTTLDFASRPDFRVVHVKLPAATTVSRARAEGVRRAGADAVAFIEDHCIPSSTWAEALIEAHSSPWAVVGYAFSPANSMYLSRAGLMAEYGAWQVPIPSGKYRHMACNNISYKRNILLQQGDQLEGLLTPDFVLHEKLHGEGLEFYLEGRAIVSHHELHTLGMLMQANHEYARFLASRRAQPWGLFRRILYAAGTPLGAPLIRLIRLARSLVGRRAVWAQFLTALPVVVLVFFWSAVGESMGHWLGPGSTAETLRYWELSAERIP